MQVRFLSSDAIMRPVTFLTFGLDGSSRFVVNGLLRGPGRRFGMDPALVRNPDRASVVNRSPGCTFEDRRQLGAAPQCSSSQDVGP